jgi:hypothetical protein
MPTSNRDRQPEPLEVVKAPWPAAPLNLFMNASALGGVDLRWDDPSYLTRNAYFQVLGVNVYRSFDSEFGPYERITDLPIGATFWRDHTDIELIVDEDVTDRFLIFGAASAGDAEKRYVFRTLNFPIVHSASQKVPTHDPHDVRVFVDGVEAKVLHVQGPTGEVELNVSYYPDTAKQNYFPPVVPTPMSRVTCTYRHARSLLKVDLGTRVFYRVTTVGLPANCNVSQVTPQDLVETPLEYAAATNLLEIEKLDWIWKEAVRRNRWILEQGGERTRLFIRKSVGLTCPCYSVIHKRATEDCTICYGTGIVGGYEGPYELLIAPDDGERRISQKDIGLTQEHSYEVWTGPQPLLNQRDFILKLNGDRFSIGAVRLPSNRGNVLQQHFTISSFDDKDIRYKVPVMDPVKFAATQFAPRGPEFGAPAEITDHRLIGDEREYRGRSLAWKNTTY